MPNWNKQKKQLLDPLGVVCKLGILYFYKSQSRIAIRDHTLILQKPDYTQGIVRLWEGDDKEAVSELYDPIKKVISWYLISAQIPLKSPGESPMATPVVSTLTLDTSKPETSQSEPNLSSLSEAQDTSPVGKDSILYDDGLKDSIIKSIELKRDPSKPYNNTHIRNIVKYACKGLEKLQRTYKSGNIVFTLQLFINYLRDGINDEIDETDFPKLLKTRESKVKSLINIENIQNIWDERTVEQLSKLFDMCNECKQKTLELDEEEMATTIDGYLNSIKSIVKMNDTKFQNLVKTTDTG